MGVKDKLLANKTIAKMISELEDIPYEIATVISPELNTIMRYKAAFGNKPNLNNPQTFSEKLLWLKLNHYMDNPLVIKCADKYAVREYLLEKGCGDILNSLIGVYNSPKEIPWDELPSQFVLKWNFGAGMNLVVKDKQSINIPRTVRLFTRWGKKKYWLAHSEMQYKYTPKKIICESFLQNAEDEVIPDYKVYCFNGKPEAILVMHDRGSTVKTEFFDCDWNTLTNTKKYSTPIKKTDRPKCLQHMIDTSKKLSEPFPFVRCDYYVVNGELYFGELTFTPAGGLYTSETLIHGKTMAELLDISCLVNKKNKGE